MTQEKAQHTPGPWSIDLNLGVFPEDGMPITDDKTDNEVCVVWPQSDDNAQAANARLIAAAPDLLAALQNLVAIGQAYDLINRKALVESTEFRRVLAAIAKATNPNPPDPMTKQQSISYTNRKRALRARAALTDYAEDTADFPHQYAVRDLLSDLMHFCRQHKMLSFEAELDAARLNFREEKTNRETETI